MNEFIQTHKLTVTIVLILIGLFIGGSVYYIIARAGKEPVSVQVLPEDATIRANGKTIRSGTAYLTAGTYTIEVGKRGFATSKTTIVVSQPNTRAIDIALDPVSDEAKQWKKDHEDLYFAYEGRAGERSRNEGESFNKINPIVTSLPYESFIYTIGYRADPADATGNSIVLEIDASDGYRNAAIDKIRSFGYDPTNFNIRFRDYGNPFSQ